MTETKESAINLTNEEIIYIFKTNSKLVNKYFDNREKALEGARALMDIQAIIKRMKGHSDGSHIGVKGIRKGPNGEAVPMSSEEMAASMAEEIKKLENDTELPIFIKTAQALVKKYETIYHFIEESGQYTNYIT